MYQIVSLMAVVSCVCLAPALAHSARFYQSPRVTAQLIVAFQDNHPTTGNDRDTVLFPNPVLDTVPTRDTGTETFSKDSPTPEINQPPPPTNDDLPPSNEENTQ